MSDELPDSPADPGADSPADPGADSPADPGSGRPTGSGPRGSGGDRRSLRRELAGLGVKVVVIVLAVVAVFAFVIGFTRNSGGDMAPAVGDGDLVVFNRLDRDYRIGDLVVLDAAGKRQVRRVVAQAGDTVDITAQGLVINGAVQQESRISEPTVRYDSSISFPLTVGPGQVFVLGDARQSAVDSRIYGPVNIADTRGTVILLLRWRGF